MGPQKEGLQKDFLKKDKTCAAIFQPHNNGHFLCIAVAQKNFIIKLQNNMMNERALILNLILNIVNLISRYV